MARSIFRGADGEGCDKRHSDICSAPTDVTLHPCGSWFREITLEQSSERVEECTAEKKERESEIMVSLGLCPRREGPHASTRRERPCSSTRRERPCSSKWRERPCSSTRRERPCSSTQKKH